MSQEFEVDDVFQRKAEIIVLAGKYMILQPRSTVYILRFAFKICFHAISNRFAEQKMKDSGNAIEIFCYGLQMWDIRDFPFGRIASLPGLSVFDILYDDGVADSFQIGVYFFIDAIHDSDIRHTAVFHIWGKSAFRIQIRHCEELLKDSVSILISTYFPVKSVARFPDNIYALESVIYRSTSGFTYRLSTAFSK